MPERSSQGMKEPLELSHPDCQRRPTKYCLYKCFELSIGYRCLERLHLPVAQEVLGGWEPSVGVDSRCARRSRTGAKCCKFRQDIGPKEAIYNLFNELTVSQIATDAALRPLFRRIGSRGRIISDRCE